MTDHLDTGAVIANNYRVTERLGAGGMGTVYLAENVTLNQRVVVKILRGGQAGAGQEEAQMLANLQHPNVVTVYAHDPSLDCIVMEFLDGASLSTLLEKGIDRVNAIRIALAVAEALAAVHRRDLVHRDIKPENVMLSLNTGGGRLVDWLKLIDFGLALKAGKTPPVLLGTPEFCGPEQFYAEQPAHPGNDVYSLGVTIFLMITGAFPFEGDVKTLPEQHLYSPVPSILDTLRARGATLEPRTAALLEDLDELVHQMMAKRADQRPTAQEVARRLTKLESSFAEAGTFVGSVGGVSSEELQPVGKRRSSTSMLQKMTRASQPSASPPVRAKSEGVIPAAQTPAPRASGAKNVPPPASLGETAPDMEPVLPDAATIRAKPLGERRQTNESDVQLTPIMRSNRPPTVLIAGLSVLVLMLVGAVLLVKPGVSPTVPEDPVIAADPEPTKKPEPVNPEPVPVPTPTPTPTPTPVPVVAAKPAEDDELGVLTKIPRKPTPAKAVAPTPTKTPTSVAKEVCVFDRDKSRAEFNRLVALIDNGDRFEDEMFAALNAADCRRAEAVLRKMQSLAKPR